MGDVIHEVCAMTSSSTAPLQVAAIPFASRRGDARENVSRVVAALDQAAREGIALAVFPETCLAAAHGSTCLRALCRAELDALAEPLDGSSIHAVAQAVERTGVAAGVGWIERAADGRLFNSYVVCMPGGARFCHRALHACGSRIGRGSRFTVFDTQWGVRVGILIGADNDVVENARVTALMGATLLLAPHRCDHRAASERDEGGGFGAIEALRRALPGRALDNGTFIVLAAGDHESGSHAGRDGSAVIVDPRGQLLADSANCKPIVSASIDRSLANPRVVQLWRDARRPALYRPLTAAAHDNSDPPAREPTAARGALPISFAVVRRSIKPPSGSVS
jgi:predicted amidohydrolase